MNADTLCEPTFFGRIHDLARELASACDRQHFKDVMTTASNINRAVETEQVFRDARKGGGMSEREVHISYRSVQTGEREWTVFVLDAREPEWWRVLAKFANKERADAYAEVETMMADDGMENDFRDLVLGNAPNLPIPQSGITPSALTRRESISHTKIEREETIAITRNHSERPEPITSKPGEAIEVETIAEDEEASGELPEPADCSTLPPLTPTQAKVFRGLLVAVRESKGVPPYSLIAKHAGVAGVAHHLPNLETKGYIKNCGSFGAPDWRPIANGEPRVEMPKDSHGRTIRPWSKEDIDGLFHLAPSSGDDYAKYAEKIGRTLDAVTQKARSLGIYKQSLVPGYNDANLPSAPAKAAPPFNGLSKPVSRVVHRIDNTANERTITAELMGDPQQGRSAAETGDFDVRAYLVRKGHTAFMAGLTWVVDGRNRTPREVLDIVNGHRAKAELPPLPMEAIP